MMYKFKVGDLVNIKDSQEIYEISGLARPTVWRWYFLKNLYNRNTIDGSFQEESLRLAPSEQPYDPTQMGDKEDDI